MPTSAMTNTITDATGGALASVSVVIRLRPPGARRVSDNSEVAPAVTVTTNASGIWTANLEQTSNISPAGSYYEATELVASTQGGPRTWAFTVPAAGPFTVMANLYSVPVS
jgi:hypothetical protein